MFQQLMPLLKERKLTIHIEAAGDQKIRLCIEPKLKKENEDEAFSTPFVATATPQEFDDEFDVILTNWVGKYSAETKSLTDALAESASKLEKNVAAAKEGAESKAKPKTPTKPVKPTTKASAKSTGKATASKGKVTPPAAGAPADSNEDGASKDGGEGNPSGGGQEAGTPPGSGSNQKTLDL